MKGMASFPGFKLRLTRWGGFFLVGSLVLAFAAVNTSNNALMAALGLVLASFAVSGSWSRETLGRARVTIIPPREIFAGAPAMFDITLENSSRCVPAYGLLIRDNEGRPIHLEAMLRRSEKRTRSVRLTFDTRGWVSLEDWRLEVLLPLGFFAKSKLVAKGRQVLVFPRILISSGITPEGIGGLVQVEQFNDRGREGDMSHLREFSEGDELRQIHWKQTARQARFITMEREHQIRSSVIFVVDTRVKDPGDRRCLEIFEKLISEVATAIVRRMEGGAAVGLVLPNIKIAPLDGRSHLIKLLKPLAEARALQHDADGPDTTIGIGA